MIKSKPNTKDIILKLKEVREKKNLSYTDIEKSIEENNEHISRSTISRVFAEGSENFNFRYEDSIRPIANALLEIETIEETDDLSSQTMKEIMKYKMNRIEELEAQIEHLQNALDKEKVRSHEKMEKERVQYERHIQLLNEQLIIKDKRMDEMSERFNKKDMQYTELVNKLISCHRCSRGDINDN